MNEKIMIRGIEIIPPEFECGSCGCEELDFRYLESNNAIQMRCANCGRFFGNYKYATPETMTMPFGKHKGERLIDIPRKYLEWLYLECDNLSGNLYEAIESILED